VRRTCLSLIVAGLVVAAAPSSASAATVFGADLSQSPAHTSNSLTVVSVIAPGGAPDLGAPVSGILVSVRVKAAGDAGTGAVRVLTETAHPDAQSYSFLNTAPEIMVPIAADALGGHVNEVLTRRPIIAGQRLAWWITYSVGTIANAYHEDTAECAYRSDHPVGTTEGYSTVACNQNPPLVSGTIEADADGDGYGDESQDFCPTNSAQQTPCPAAPSQPKAKKCKKGKGKKKAKTAAAKKKCKKRGKKKK
jgi:hypothetical protein